MTSTSPAVPRAGTSSSRVGWVDAAKGIAIVLVVLHHSLQWLADSRGAPPVLLALDEQLSTFRMPLFFLASGLFAARPLRAGLRVVVRRRVATYAWVFAVWSTLGVVAAATGFSDRLEHSLPVAWLLGFVEPSSKLWFLYALALYSLVAALAVRVPAAWQIGAATALSVVVGSGVLPVDGYVWRAMAINLVFFLVGVHGSALVRRLAEALPLLAVLGAAAAYVLLSLWIGDREVVGSRLVLSVLALATGVGIAVALSRSRAGRAVEWLGQRTLPVYVMHTLWMKVVGRAANTWAEGAPDALVVVLVLVTAVALSLATHAVLVRMRCRWLFALPSAWALPAQGATSGAATTGKRV
ncbi:acyltransferase [Streptomyces sp. NP160]|uniref:acyltransferase family protein n=1 Tax=Streptomyces sp. NP160 TaxID=2586637 RepID=UPI001118D12F|nr:acyltransferase family protein [Streptomyces sp. NP160]TNM61043.1 acyltransferase [Streptomyces sp. NP160]